MLEDLLEGGRNKRALVRGWGRYHDLDRSGLPVRFYRSMRYRQ